MTIGFAGVFAGVVIILARSILQGQVVNSLTSDASLQVTIRHVYNISTAILKDVASAVIFIGIVLVAAAWFAGPPAGVPLQAGDLSVPARTGVATYGIVLGILVLVFIWNPIPATGKPLGILVFTVLALSDLHPHPANRSRIPGCSLGRRHAGDPRPHGERTFETSRAGQPASPNAPTTAEQLSQLADLRDRGAISPDEYQTAKAKLLNG